jgi:hypothetical protein
MYKMSLLANVNQPTTGQYYFALDTNSGTTVVEAPAFIATGTGEPGNDGRFIARGDASGSDLTGAALGFQMRKGGASATLQWAVGMTDTPTGGGNGNNFVVVAYDDNGAPISVPLAINRATGAIEASDSLTVGYDATVGGGGIFVRGTLGDARVYDPVYNPPPSVGGWTTFFNETAVALELEEAANTPIFTIPLPPALQNATKYTVRVMDINIPVIQGSTLARALVYFDYNPARNGISYVSGGAGESSGCDNNFIWLGNGTGGTGGKLQSGTSFTNPSSGPLNDPIAPFSNNAFFADSGASPTASLASLNLPVFNIFNYNGDTGITNLYCVFNPDPNNGTQSVGQMGAGARLRCIVEASFAPKY